MTKVANEDDLFQIYTLVTYDNPFDHKAKFTDIAIKRCPKSPPLLAEIISIIEQKYHPMQQDVMTRASHIRDSNKSLAELNSNRRRRRRDTIPLYEPSLNILNTLSNLRDIIQGGGGGGGTTTMTTSAATSPTSSTSTINRRRLSKSTTAATTSTTTVPDRKRLTPNSRFYDECLYYLITFGSHSDIVAFLVRYKQIRAALVYCQQQFTDDTETFIHTIILPYLRRGRADAIVALMIEMDETLLQWRRHIIAICRYLEKSSALNCLYHLQILFKDPVRASMTCVIFYTKDCSTYADLQVNSFHLQNAQKHLQQELETCQWDQMGGGVAVGGGVANKKEVSKQTWVMKVDSKTLNNHINTVWRQIEVTKFLANCEQEGRPTVKLLSKVINKIVILKICITVPYRFF